MAQNRRRRRRKQSSSTPLLMGLVGVMAVILLLSLGLRLALNALPDSIVQESSDKPSLTDRLFGSSEPTEKPRKDIATARASILATGDVLMHYPIISSAMQPAGGYNFEYLFRYVKSYTRGADLSVANLETTLCGDTGGYPYSGYPAFNCPDTIVDALKSAGFDLLLTANNHCYDTKDGGFRRTVEVIRDRGLEALGTRTRENEPKFVIRNVNGIRIGLVCYTYESPPEKPQEGMKYMNRVAMSTDTAPLINSFLTAAPDPFYMEMRDIMAQMKAAGAEATVLFLHWGTEYETNSNAVQFDMAQTLCDMGFDAIIGSHPHVIQPVTLLSNRFDTSKKTVCLYSAGNFVSNQRKEEMDLQTGHTEDALLFTVTFARYPDGTVFLEDAELLPCWVDLRGGEGGEYDVIPLTQDNLESWAQDYGMSAESIENAKLSLQRTQEITGSGMERVQQYLAEHRQQLEDAYFASQNS